MGGSKIMTSTPGRRGDPLSTYGTKLGGAVLLLVTAMLVKMGWCGCTLFALNSWVLLGASVLLLGNRSFGVLASEKEKKTLDCLRLTQLTPDALFWFKLAPEFRSLARLLGFFAPSLLFSSLSSPSGLAAGLGVLAIAAVAGTMSIVMSLFVSSLAASTSRAVVNGWTMKACWLLLTPVFDLVVAAVTVTTERRPVFDVLNPFAASWSLVVPEAEVGFRQHLPLAFVLLGLVVTAIMWKVAARRFEQGLLAAPVLTDRQIHQLYRQTPGWMPGFLGLKDNPVFLRELASQLRTGAGRWPGYAVFITLFLAPFLYSQSWNVRRSSEMQWNRPPQVRVEPSGSSSATSTSPATPSVAAPSSQSFVRLRGWDGTELRLKGHKNCACLRMELHRVARVPLPASAVVKVQYNDPFAQLDSPEPQRPGPAEVPLSAHEASQYGVAHQPSQAADRELSVDVINQIRNHSMNQGLLGCLVLLSLYLAVRCSGFLSNAVTSECDRRSWSDLALTGIGPHQVLQGKLAGALVMPLFQLLVASPSLLFFVAAGVVSPLGAFQLISYALLMGVVAGLIGLWASSSSASSHSAQGLALASVLAWLVVVPAVAGGFSRSLMFPLAGLALIALTRGQARAALGWALVAAAAMLAPASLSPWSCLPTTLMINGASSGLSFFTWVGGMLALSGVGLAAYQGALGYLQQPGQEDALWAERVAV